MTIKAVILVGGEKTGTRFRPLSMEQPKVLFPIVGKPFISHIIENFISQLDGIEPLEILLIGFHKDVSSLQQYIKEISGKHPWVKIVYKAEPGTLGTGGGLYYFRDEILDSNNDKLFYINGDVICDYPFKQLLDFYNSHNQSSVIYGVDPTQLLNNNLIGLTSLEPEARQKIFNKFGIIVSDKKTNEVIHYVEKPTTQFTLDTTHNVLINGGIYIFNKDIFKYLERAQLGKRRASKIFLYDDLESDSVDPNSLSLELDVLKILPQSSESKFYSFNSTSFWYLLKTPMSALLANRYFLEQTVDKESLKGVESIIPPVQVSDSSLGLRGGYKIGPYVSFGKNVSIGNGVRIKNSIISDNVTIGDNSYIVNSIISEGVKIGKWCRIEGEASKQSVLNDIDTKTNSNLKLENNIVILSKGVSLVIKFSLRVSLFYLIKRLNSILSTKLLCKILKIMIAFTTVVLSSLYMHTINEYIYIYINNYTLGK
ncbi:putative mannose-1-phosphate guanyltransferase [Scheffersomyces amazonensis]|uniref:putative mannose-1-phosphate guanyltransferase n=1 Tax=Scheffersomyces amazonensis TaxID=1078765 RepID=UPI00315DBA6C